MLRKILIGVGALFALLVVIGLFTDSGTDDAASTNAAPTTPTPATTAPAKTPAPPAAKPKPAKTTVPAEPVDSGRMSDTEFGQLMGAHSELVDESLQYSSEIQACSVIGQTGDLVGFRDCVDDAYSGFEEDVDFAIYTADDLLGDTAKQCQAALRSYAKITRAYQATVALTYDVANRLAFDEFEGAFGALGPASKQYGKFSTNALAACQPK